MTNIPIVVHTARLGTKFSLFFLFIVFTLSGCASTRQISMNNEELFQFTASEMDISSVTLKDGRKIIFDISDGKLERNLGDSTLYITGFCSKQRHVEEVKIPLFQVQEVNGRRVEGDMRKTLVGTFGALLASWILFFYLLRGFKVG